MSFILAACGHSADILRPVAGVSGISTARVDMLVATTREPSRDAAVRYTGQRGEDVRLDNIVVSVPPASTRQAGKIKWPNPQAPDPRRSFVTVKADQMTNRHIKSWFKTASGGNHRVLIFVHGFNTSYADAVFRFAQVVHDAGIEAAPVLFTWPSRANPLDYAYDRESTIYSRFGLDLVLKSAVDDPSVEDVTIFAHSMGGWLTMEALRDMALREGRVSRKIHDVILASPDIDVDVFKRQVLEIGSRRPHITIISSRNDLALQTAKWLAGDVDRLGATDFKPYSAILSKYNISVIDTSDLSQDDFFGHNAYAQNQDLLRSLAGLYVSRSKNVIAPKRFGRDWPHL
ncbi:alpha/beta fold hydrolase [Mesorhizobium sp. CU2]|uniref:alpha/beta hydrolase n=1 Tax=unclassified Mesorhizobium TaxID=325217 RepID=UPI00112CFF05|nr:MULTISPECIES: alpha/beta fold hydrolase [unclassified Mesorhizobium]TPN81111.1 alpha/beta fold hydrolase [Mesorhizobium sp. CU3]TPO17091.1 alpha/beta fold hydrolase [Mesorhizobium sp. CU2]